MSDAPDGSGGADAAPDPTSIPDDPPPGWTPDPEEMAAIVEYYYDRPVELMEALGYTLADTQKIGRASCRERVYCEV